MKTTLEDLYDFQLFEMFFQAVVQEGGDGIGIVLCEDPHDLSERFLKWCEAEGKPKSWVGELERDVKEDLVNFHNSNENFIFTSDEGVTEDPFADAVFIVKGNLVTAKGEVIQE